MLKNNLFLILLYNIIIIYFGYNNPKYFFYLFFSTFIFSSVNLFILCYFLRKETKKIQGVFQTILFILSLLYVFSLIFFIPDILSIVLPIFFILIWFSFIREVAAFSKSKLSFTYNSNDYSSFYYKLITDFNLATLSKINLLCLPYLLIVFITSIYIYYYENIIFLALAPFLIISIIVIYIKRKIKIEFIKMQNNALNLVCKGLEYYKPQFILYFSGNSQTTFQINSWLPVITKNNFRFLIIVRELHHYDFFEDKNILTVFLKNTRDVEKVASISSIKAALYISNVGKNIHLIRSNNIKHIFIGHGDSDKSSSANNIMKLYDHMFVAGEAHIDRMKNQNIQVNDNYFFKIGRPSLEIAFKDYDYNKKIKNKNYEKINLLYAPTWEGYFQNSSYSSLNKINASLKDLICKNKENINFIFKSHPHTGVVDSEYNNISLELSKLSNNNDKHITLYDYFKDADILISDISGVLSDFIYLNKPIILYIPKFIDNPYKDYPISKCTYIIRDKKNDLEKMIQQIKADDYLSKEREDMKEYILGRNNDPQKLFNEALSSFLK